nr:acyl-coenzyme A thioesterase 13-like [Ipomoea batatas]
MGYGREQMEKAKESVEASKEEAERVSSLSFTPHRQGVDHTTFYSYFCLRGIRVDICRPGFILLPLSKSLHDSPSSFNVTVAISITYLSTAKLHAGFGNMGSYFGTSIVVKNKASGEIIADGENFFVP